MKIYQYNEEQVTSEAALACFLGVGSVHTVLLHLKTSGGSDRISVAEFERWLLQKYNLIYQTLFLSKVNTLVYESN